MYEFFTKEPKISRPMLVNGNFNNLRVVYKQEIMDLKKHYRSFPFYLSDSNFISTIIKIAKDYVPFEEDFDKFVFGIKSQMNEVVTGMKMFSDFNFGAIHKEKFFANAMEIIIATKDNFDKETPWQELSPVTCVYHSHNGLDLIIPTVKMTQSKRFDLPVIIKINIPMLMWQFRCWYLENQKKDDTRRESYIRFVIKYPLMNYMDSHLDIAFINRFMDQFINLGISDVSNLEHQWKFIKPTSNRYDLTVANMDRKVDAVTEDLYRELKKKNITPDELFAIIPIIGKGTGLDALYLGSHPASRQIEWVLAISRYRHIAFALFHTQIVGKGINTAFNRDVRSGLQLLMVDKSWVTLLPSVNKTVMNEIKKDIIPYINRF